MNRRLAPFAALALAGSLAVSAFAQGFRGGFQQGLSPMRLSSTLQTKLNLTADQKTKLEAVQTKYRQDLQAAFQGGGGGREAFQKLSQDAEASALAIFTADQKKMYEGWKAEVEPFTGIGRTHVALLGVTGLNADQKAKLKELASKLQSKRMNVIQSANGDFGSIREPLQALETEADAGIKGILTADQQKQFATEVAALPQIRRRQQ